MYAFIICGYGIPQDIDTDLNYGSYLRLVFNHIYEEAAGQDTTIVPCGGPTNCTPPFEGTEAELITDYLSKLADREYISPKTTDWTFIPEKESLSTLENFVFAKRILDGIDFEGDVTIFCEKTREQKVQAFTEAIFSIPVTIAPIDFDITVNRYLDPAVIAKKEASGIKEGLWTLEDPQRLEKHHEFFERKIDYLRKRQSEGLSHEDAVKEWFERQEEIVRELMPDHPLLSS